MSEPFMDLLRRYFADRLGEDPGELHVSIYHDPGYSYSEYNSAGPAFRVRVHRTKDGRGDEVDYGERPLVFLDDDEAGEFLQGLFAWEDGDFTAQRVREELRAEAQAETERQKRSEGLSGHPAWD